MSILKKLSVVTAGIACAAVSNLGSISAAVAINLDIVGGQFEDGTTFTGSFTYDPGTNTIPIFDITTNSGPYFPGGRYTSSNNSDFTITGADEDGYRYLYFYDNYNSPFEFNNLLTLVSFNFTPNSTEYPIFFGGENISQRGASIRSVSAGSLVEATPVPFKFSPGLGILALGACGAIDQLRRKMQNRKLAASAFSPK